MAARIPSKNEVSVRVRVPAPYFQNYVIMEVVRKCSRCRQDKELAEFAFRDERRGLLQGWCRSCQKVYRREHYDKNKAKYIAKAMQWNAAFRDAIIAEFKDKPCVDCGVKYIPYAMDFDHVRGIKRANVSTMYPRGDRQKIVEEIAKCDVVCANCHRIRTWNRFNK